MTILRRTRRFLASAAFLMLLWADSEGIAQQGNPPKPATESETQSVQPSVGNAEASTPSPARPKQPKYLNLRYDDDFSYLDGEPASYQPDFFDPIKNIHWGEDWRLSLGGEFRFRLEAETNKAFGTTEPAQDTFALFRYLLHADVKYRDSVRIFVQGIAAFDEDRDLPLRVVDENQWDLQQLFVDLRVLGDQRPLTLRVGRQELQYGNERLVSPLEWTNVRRRFDGVKLFAKGETWDIDVWYVKPVPVQRKQRDHFDEDVNFYGLHTTYKGIPRHGLDVYFFARDDTGRRVNPNGAGGDRDIYTLGSRAWGAAGGFDYEAELAGQWGHWAHDTVQAWSWTLDGGYTFPKATWKPRLGAGFDWASGDEEPTDRKVETFDQLFPLGHKYFGFLDLIGRQNITAVNANLSAWPVVDRVRTAVAYHAFWLNAKEDALYDVGGTPGRRDPSGEADTEVGQEIDLTLMWTLDVHSSFLFGYSHFWDGEFLQDSGGSENADLFYVQYAFKF